MSNSAKSVNSDSSNSSDPQKTASSKKKVRESPVSAGDFFKAFGRNLGFLWPIGFTAGR